MLQAVTVTGGKTTVKIEIMRISGQSVFVQAGGQSAETFHGAKVTTSVAVTITGFHTGPEAVFKGLLPSKVGKISGLQPVKLLPFRSWPAVHVDVDIAQ